MRYGNTKASVGSVLKLDDGTEVTVVQAEATFMDVQVHGFPELGRVRVHLAPKLILITGQRKDEGR